MTSRRNLLLALLFLAGPAAYQPVFARDDRWDDDDDDDDDDRWDDDDDDDDRRRRNRPRRRERDN